MARSLVPGRSVVFDSQDSFSGGLNTVADEAAVAENQVRRADNARLSVEGGVRKRLGQQYVAADPLVSGQPTRGGYGWRKPTSVEEMVVTDGGLYVGTYGIGMSFTHKVGTLASGVRPSFAGFIANASTECAYIADGGSLNKYDGTSLSTDLADTPGVSQLRVYNQRLYGISGLDQSVYGSGLNDGDSLGQDANGGFEAIVRTFGNQKLTALSVVKNSLLLFHVSGISRFTGISQDDFDVAAGAQGLSGNTGTIAPGSIVEVTDPDSGVDMAMFVADRGVFGVTEAGIFPIPNPIRSILAQLSQVDFARVAAAHNKAYSEVLFYLPDSGVYVYNYALKAWAGPWTGGFTDVITYSMWDTLDELGRPIVLSGKANGHVARLDAPRTYLDLVASDGTGGSPFTFAVRLRRLFAKDFTMEKSWKWAHILTTTPSSTASLRYATSMGGDQVSLGAGVAGGEQSWGGGGSTWGAGTWGGGSSIPRRVPIGGRGGWIDLTIVDDGRAESLYSGVTVEGTTLGRRGS